MNHLILASGSPRRRELLSLYTTDFTVCVSDFDESAVTAPTPAQLVEQLAIGKCLAVAKQHPDAVVIGCDTVVDVDGTVFGKPHDAEDAKRMLRALSGKTHQVHTGVCIAKGDRTEHFVDSCKVTFFRWGRKKSRSTLLPRSPTIRPVPMPFRGARPCGWTASRATITPLWGCRSAAPYRRWRIFCEKNGKMIENLPKRLRNGALAAIIEPCYSAQEGLFAAGRPAFWDRFKERS